MISRIRFSQEEKSDDAQTSAVLSNDDEIFGGLKDASLTLVSEYGTVELKPETIRAFQFTPSQPGKVQLSMWDGSVFRGQLKQEELTFRIAPGPTLKLPLGQIASISCSKVAVPDTVKQDVEKHVARLGSESFKDRQAAVDALIKMGPPIIPLLQKYLTDNDPEVRQRIGEVIEKLSAGGTTPTAPPMMNFRMGVNMVQPVMQQAIMIEDEVCGPQ
jgi:hypothetical protein